MICFNQIIGSPQYKNCFLMTRQGFKYTLESWYLDYTGNQDPLFVIQ